MAYFVEISKVLAKTLEKFSTLNRYQLAGHVANLDFWSEEVRHCLGVIDGYRSRFDAMKAAQAGHTSEHQVISFDRADPWFDTAHPVEPPKRIPDTEIKDARRSLCDAFYRFVVRCYNEQLLDKPGLERAADFIGIGIEASDLKR